MSSAPRPNARTCVVARRIKSTDVRDQQIRNHRVEESPNHIDHCRGEPSAGRFGKGALKRASHRAGDKVWDGIRRKNSPKEIRHKPKPIHAVNPQPGASAVQVPPGVCPAPEQLILQFNERQRQPDERTQPSRSEARRLRGEQLHPPLEDRRRPRSGCPSRLRFSRLSALPCRRERE